MPFDGLEEKFTATLTKRERWRNCYLHPRHGTDWGVFIWPSKEAAEAAVAAHPGEHWLWGGYVLVLKSETAVQAIQFGTDD